MPKNDKIKLAILLLLWVMAFIPIFPELVRAWFSHSDNSHGFIVPIMAGYLAWQRKAQLLSATTDSSFWGGVFLFLTLAGYFLSYAGGIAFFSRVALVLSLLGLIWCCLGKNLTKILAFPVLFLLFMIPVPYSLMSEVSPPLQLVATRISASLIDICSIPVYREGNMLYFVGTQLEVAEACSGIRSIMSLTMLSVIFASMLRSGWGRKALLMACVVPVAMLANIIRITGTGILAHYYGSKVARGFLHEFSGIVVFTFGFVVLLGIFAFMNGKKDANVK